MKQTMFIQLENMYTTYAKNLLKRLGNRELSII